jgi:hypothetical protein
MSEQPNLGPTGEYPLGRLNPTDEGEIVVGVTTEGPNVVIAFGKPVAWLAMPAAQAKQLAGLLMLHAADAARDPNPGDRP